ncbi:hypothetical protein ACSVDE_01215 [Pseudalkalibacillus sp. Hm43]|uniref:hypothetical protein n=1 Tax=Pseudalkalibacillus sp. Hm43 TaxID=3450742 RepID=UPI003F41ED13
MYAMDTLPTWVWVMYFAYIIASMVVSFHAIRKKRLIVLSVLHIGFTITTPIIGFVHAIERIEGNELNHLIRGLENFELWSVYVLVGYVYSFVWWILYLFKKKNGNF